MPIPLATTCDMMSAMEDTTQIQEKKEVKRDPVGLSFYGDRFWKFTKVGEMVELLPLFKEFYYAERVKNMKGSIPEMMQRFNVEYAYPENKTFYPYPSQLKLWRRKWDRDILEKKYEMKMEDDAITPRREIQQVIKTRNENNELARAPQDGELEVGLRTLGGELTNDALQMLRDDQELEDIYDTDELIKRRNYIVGVFGHVTKLVHGKAALMLKASEEKRNNANFLMTLLAKASAGKISDEEVEVLEVSYTPKDNVPAA